MVFHVATPCILISSNSSNKQSCTPRSKTRVSVLHVAPGNKIDMCMIFCSK